MISLGYVGLPLAVALARQFATIGLDSDRVAELRSGRDRTGEIATKALAASGLELSDDPSACAGCDIFIVTVPTPVDKANQPNLAPLEGATGTVAGRIDPAKTPLGCRQNSAHHCTKSRFAL